MLPIRTILHPTDFSPQSGHAFQLASALARDYGARLLLLHVEPPALVCSEGYILPPGSEAVRYEMLQQLNRLRPPDPSTSVRRIVTGGDPASEIVGTAQEVQCNLIVMGTHGRTGVGRLLMGSVAEAVLRKAPCPVLTVKAPVPAAFSAPGAVLSE